MTASAALPTGYRRIAFGRVGSTNDEAKRLATAGAAHGLVVTAEEQTGGRGRAGRSWISPFGNLYASIVLRFSGSPARASEIGLVAALAVAKALAAWLSPEAKVSLKWPNDVLIGGEKVAGVLLESSSTGTSIDWIVVGVGLNIAHHPHGSAWPATSLARSGRTKADREPTLAAFLDRFEVLYDRWQQSGFPSIRPDWLALAFGYGALIEIGQGSKRRAGRFIEIDDAGGLVLETADGRQIIAHGEFIAGGA